jgi:hypothetical protein
MHASDENESLNMTKTRVLKGQYMHAQRRLARNFLRQERTLDDSLAKKLGSSEKLVPRFSIIYGEHSFARLQV